MGQTIRFGVSLGSTLLKQFDDLCSLRGYHNRSEAVRDLIRKALVEEEWRDDETEAAATLTLVYDHHKSDLAQRLMEVQHDAHHLIITTQHIHLDHDNCLEVLILKGPSIDIRRLAESLTSIKGVMFGKLSLATTGKNLC